MTDQQWRKFLDVFAGFTPEWLHHGDCVGADAQAHAAAAYGSVRIHLHPADFTTKRAWCTGAELMAGPAPPLVRNRVMVDVSEALIATPRLMVEELRSGTWATVRYARKCRVPVHIVWPDGTYIAPP